MRPGNFKMDVIDESVFSLSGVQKIADEDNLALTFSNPELTSFLEELGLFSDSSKLKDKDIQIQKLSRNLRYFPRDLAGFEEVDSIFLSGTNQHNSKPSKELLTLVAFFEQIAIEKWYPQVAEN